MLAKVLKNNSVNSAMPVSIPEIGGINSESRNIKEFVFPSAADFQITEEFDELNSEPETGADISTNAEEILENARHEAAKIISQAEENAVNIALAAGEKAESEVQSRFAEEVAASAAEIRQQLAETIERISGLSSVITNRLEADLVTLALQIAKKIVAREVTIDREIALTLVKISLGKLHNRSVAEVHLNPEDFSFVQAHREKLDFRGSLELVEDRSIPVGGCLIHTETGDIDARIESQFEEIAHGLLEG